MKNMKKLLALTLLVMMVLSLMPMAVSASGEIIGNTKITRAPLYKYAVNTYSFPTEPEAVFSVSGAPSGVTMMPDGNLIVPGGIKLGSVNSVFFDVVAKNSAGEELATLTVELLNKINYDKTSNNWVDYPKRHYHNFDLFAEGETPTARKIGSSTWDDMPMQMGSITSRVEPAPPVIVAEENGNKYVKSAGGYFGWDATKPSFDFQPKTFPSANQRAFYARFKLEPSIIDKKYTLLSFSNTNNEIRYNKVSDGVAGIYLYSTNSPTTDALMTIEAGKWFELWMNTDVENATSDIYVNVDGVITSADARKILRVAAKLDKSF